jgi:hypothetical protein
MATAAPPDGVPSVIALGASNLTRGLPAVVSAARAAFGADVDVVAALGLGRSYGARSRVLARSLPGILDSGLWSALESRPYGPARALVTDVGNDILYGSPPEQILEWVAACVERLRRHTPDVVLTDLPRDSIRRLSTARFLFFRSALFPRCRLSHGEVMDRVERVVEGLAALAEARSLRFVRLRPEWYGFDPVHFRLGCWGPAWREIVGVDGAPPPRRSLREMARLYAMFPERQWLFGVEQKTSQARGRLAGGGRVQLY